MTTRKWYHVQNDDRVVNSIDTALVTRFVTTSSVFFYMIRSVSKPYAVSPYVKPKTVMTALKRGHTDLQAWQYANAMERETYYDELLNRYGSKLVPNGATMNWVLDLDDVSPLESIDDLKTAMVVRGCPLPSIVVQTGPNNFHCVYDGQYGAWPEEKRWWVVEKWSGIQPERRDEREMAAIAAGVDVGYVFGQSIWSHKFRIPGSINTNHVIDGRPWICSVWKNHEYADPQLQYLRENSLENLIVPVGENVIAAPITRVAPNYEVYRKPIFEVLHDFFPRGFEGFETAELANQLAQNAGWLARKECRIRQVTWAERLGIPQVQVSRLLKRLVGCGILARVSESYQVGKFAKTYAAGPNLLPALGHLGEPPAMPNWVRWDDGTSQERMLIDIRYFVGSGLPDVEVLDKLQERQAHRPEKDRRRVDEFIRLISKHRAYLKNCGRLPTAREMVDEEVG